MGRRMGPRLVEPTKMSLAIGAPEARVFLEPQRTATISSAVEKLSSRARVVVMVRTMARRAPVQTKVRARVPGP